MTNEYEEIEEVDDDIYEELDDEVDEYDDTEDEYLEGEYCALGFDCYCSDCNECEPYGGPSYCPYRLIQGVDDCSDEDDEDYDYGED